MKVIRQSYTFLPSHQAKSTIKSMVLFLNKAKSPAAEHPPPVVLWEHCVPANVFKTMVLQPFTFSRDKQLGIRHPFLFNLTRLSLLNIEIRFFWLRCQVMTSCLIRLNHFVSFSQVCNATTKLFQQSFLHSRFDLGQNIACVNFKVFYWTLTKALSDRHLID